MSRPFRFLALLILLTGFYASSKAQGAVQIIFDPIIPDNDVVSPDTAACFSDPLVFNAMFKNIGSDPYTGLIVLKMQTPLGIFAVDSVFVTAMGPADSAGIFLPDSISAARFGGGTNIIVIWPETGVFLPGDTIIDTVFVECGSNTQDPKNKGQIIAYPNPSDDGRFLLRSKGFQTHSTLLEVSDAAGRLLWRSESWKEEIDLADLPRGIYMLRAYPPHSEPVTIKLIR